MAPVEDLPNFCIKIRLEGKDGIKRVRIPYNPANDTHETLLNSILERYLPEEGFLDPSDFAVRLKEIGDPEWPIDIENTKDIALAISCTPAAREDMHLKMCAYIRLKSDPEQPTGEQEEGPAAAEGAHGVADHAPIAVAPIAVAAITPAAAVGSAGKKRRVSSAKATPTKRRKSGGGRGGGPKLPVRARIIGSIAELRALGKENPPRIHVAMFAGYSNASSKGFSNPLSSLKTEGLISYPDKSSVALTAAGLASEEARAVVPPKNDDEVHVRIKALLTPKQQQIFDVLAADAARVYDRDRVAAAVGYSNPASKGWSNSISKMSSLGLLHYPKDANDPKKKLLQLTEMCCPFGGKEGVDADGDDDDGHDDGDEEHDDDEHDGDDESEGTAPYAPPTNGETNPYLRYHPSALNGGTTPYASYIQQVKTEETMASYAPPANAGTTAAHQRAPAALPEATLSAPADVQVVGVFPPFSGNMNRYTGGYHGGV